METTTLVHGYPTDHWENDTPAWDPHPERHYDGEMKAWLDQRLAEDLTLVRELRRRQAEAAQ